MSSSFLSFFFNNDIILLKSIFIPSLNNCSSLFTIHFISSKDLIFYNSYKFVFFSYSISYLNSIFFINLIFIFFIFFFSLIFIFIFIFYKYLINILRYIFSGKVRHFINIFTNYVSFIQKDLKYAVYINRLNFFDLYNIHLSFNSFILFFIKIKETKRLYNLILMVYAIRSFFVFIYSFIFTFIFFFFNFLFKLMYFSNIFYYFIYLFYLFLFYSRSFLNFIIFRKIFVFFVNLKNTFLLFLFLKTNFYFYNIFVNVFTPFISRYNLVQTFNNYPIKHSNKFYDLLFFFQPYNFIQVNKLKKTFSFFYNIILFMFNKLFFYIYMFYKFRLFSNIYLYNFIFYFFMYFVFLFNLFFFFNVKIFFIFFYLIFLIFSLLKIFRYNFSKYFLFLSFGLIINKLFLFIYFFIFCFKKIFVNILIFFIFLLNNLKYFLFFISFFVLLNINGFIDFNLYFIIYFFDYIKNNFELFTYLYKVFNIILSFNFFNAFFFDNIITLTKFEDSSEYFNILNTNIACYSLKIFDPVLFSYNTYLIFLSDIFLFWFKIISLFFNFNNDGLLIGLKSINFKEFIDIYKDLKLNYDFNIFYIFINIFIYKLFFVNSEYFWNIFNFEIHSVSLYTLFIFNPIQFINNFLEKFVDATVNYYIMDYENRVSFFLLSYLNDPSTVNNFNLFAYISIPFYLVNYIFNLKCLYLYSILNYDFAEILYNYNLSHFLNYIFEYIFLIYYYIYFLNSNLSHFFVYSNNLINFIFLIDFMYYILLDFFNIFNQLYINIYNLFFENFILSFFDNLLYNFRINLDSFYIENFFNKFAFFPDDDDIGTGEKIGALPLYLSDYVDKLFCNEYCLTDIDNFSFGSYYYNFDSLNTLKLFSNYDFINMIIFSFFYFYYSVNYVYLFIYLFFIFLFFYNLYEDNSLKYDFYNNEYLWYLYRRSLTESEFNKMCFFFNSNSSISNIVSRKDNIIIFFDTILKNVLEYKSNNKKENLIFIKSLYNLNLTELIKFRFFFNSLKDIYIFNYFWKNNIISYRYNDMLKIKDSMAILKKDIKNIIIYFLKLSKLNVSFKKNFVKNYIYLLMNFPLNYVKNTKIKIFNIFDFSIYFHKHQFKSFYKIYVYNLNLLLLFMKINLNQYHNNLMNKIYLHELSFVDVDPLSVYERQINKYLLFSSVFIYKYLFRIDKVLLKNNINCKYLLHKDVNSSFVIKSQDELFIVSNSVFFKEILFSILLIIYFFNQLMYNFNLGCIYYEHFDGLSHFEIFYYHNIIWLSFKSLYNLFFLLNYSYGYNELMDSHINGHFLPPYWNDKYHIDNGISLDTLFSFQNIDPFYNNRLSYTYTYEINFQYFIHSLILFIKSIWYKLNDFFLSSTNIWVIQILFIKLFIIIYIFINKIWIYSKSILYISNLNNWNIADNSFIFGKLKKHFNIFGKLKIL